MKRTSRLDGLDWTGPTGVQDMLSRGSAGPVVHLRLGACLSLGHASPHRHAPDGAVWCLRHCWALRYARGAKSSTELPPKFNRDVMLARGLYLNYTGIYYFDWGTEHIVFSVLATWSPAAVRESGNLIRIVPDSGTVFRAKIEEIEKTIVFFFFAPAPVSPAPKAIAIQFLDLSPRQGI